MINVFFLNANIRESTMTTWKTQWCQRQTTLRNKQYIPLHRKYLYVQCFKGLIEKHRQNSNTKSAAVNHEYIDKCFSDAHCVRRVYDRLTKGHGNGKSLTAFFVKVILFVVVAKCEEAHDVCAGGVHDLACSPSFYDNDGISVNRHRRRDLCTICRPE